MLQEDMIGLLEPINNRITDPRYYLNTPHQGKQTSRVSFRREGSPKSERLPQHLPHQEGDAEGAQGLLCKASTLGAMVSHFLPL